MPDVLIACVAPSYIERAGERLAPQDLATCDCLGFAGTAIEERWENVGPGSKVAIAIKSRFSANSGQALRQAALAGFGVVLQAEELTAEDVRARRLVRLLPAWRSSRPMHLLFAPDRRVTPKLRSFIDFAAARFG